MPNKPSKPESAAIWNPFTAKSRADKSAQEMYPGKIGQDDQRDAARHMLASGYLAKAWSPGVADLIGKAHEFKETPFRHLGALAGMSQHRYDRPIDLHNNALGIELAQKAGSMEEFERLVNEVAERARPTQTPGAPWVPSAKDAEAMRKGSAQYQKGGSVATFKDGGGAATGFFPQMRPRRAANSGAGDRMTEEALKFFIPQDTMDLALMAFPFGKAGKAAAAGLMALTPADTEAGKLKTGVDLARRSLFGLKPSQEMAGRELAPVQRDLDKMQAELNRAEKAAPKVEERSVSIDPGKGSAKVTDTIQKVAETPVSRRTVLKSASGQVLQGALPASSFADLMKPATVAKQAVQAVAPAALSMDALPALIAEAIRKGMDEKQAVDYVRKLLPDAEKQYFVDDMYHTYKNPELFAAEEPQGAGAIMRNMMGMKSGEIGGDPIFSIRPRIRAMQERAPEMYDELRQTAKDIAEYGFEP